MKLCLVELLKFDLMYFFVVLYHVSDCQCLFCFISVLPK